MTTRRTAIAGMVTALMLGLTAAGTAAPAVDNAAERTPGEAYKRTELYFGGSKPDGSVITPTDFELFVDKEVTPAFPDGLTWLEAHGQWMGGKEDSYVLILLYLPTKRSANRDIEEIRTDYKKQFQQQSVLRADSVERVSF
ncbi:DUF3574 domain-containing protein [Kibdelosporangium philippinense]|uniref:DUF3574 domain-containing protein n=1 Tax=Kibdelosporangium philippinense TaxID=211113 RepID=A0ABS8ZW50_9PSEU|nr:DUF3574 domain-containing protein [Kibdelosporangium philippinense]MCE7010623.1 DUF3574 domain-containing protein [Kibdelosporangium philippinense]